MMEIPSLSWLRSESVIAIFAAIGGIIVLIGLWMEYSGADEKKYKNIEAFRALKKREKRGEIVVMVGIVVEVIVAVVFAWRDDSHIRQISIVQQQTQVALTNDEQKTAFVLTGLSNLAPYLFSKGYDPTNPQSFISNQVQQVKTANSNLLARVNIANPRLITEKQRENFITILSDSHVSKIAIPIVIGSQDDETVKFAEHFREMLNASGFGKDAPLSVPPPKQNILFTTTALQAPIPIIGPLNNEGIEYIPGLSAKSSAQDGQPTNNTPEVFAIMSDTSLLTGHPAPGTAPMFMDLKATPNGPKGGEVFVYHPTDDPNAIIAGICNALVWNGISVGVLQSKTIFPNGQVGFLVPQKF